MFTVRLVAFVTFVVVGVNSDHPLERLLATFRATEPLGKQGRSFERLMRWWLLNDPEFKARYSSASKPRKDKDRAAQSASRMRYRARARRVLDLISADTLAYA